MSLEQLSCQSNDASYLPDRLEGIALIFLCIGFALMFFGLIKKQNTTTPKRYN
jgi:hypothetical protein